MNFLSIFNAPKRISQLTEKVAVAEIVNDGQTQALRMVSNTLAELMSTISVLIERIEKLERRLEQ